MRFHPKLILVATLLSLQAPSVFAQPAITDAEVIRASEALLKAQTDAKAWQTFQEVVRAEASSPEVRSRVMYLFAVNHLLRMNTNLYASAMQTLQAQFPSESPALAERLASADWLAQCPECGGAGVKKADAPAGQSVPARCLACVGSGQIFQLSPRVKSQVGALLAEIKALAAENIQFAEASKKALAEFNTQRRLAALQELVAKYAHRKDLGEVRQALDKTLAEVAKAEESARQKEAERAAREQEDKEYQAICSGLEDLPVSGIAVMAREIERFIEKHPQSPNRLELEIQKAKLLHREKVHAYAWKGFYVCAGLAALSLFVSLVRELFARKRKATGPLPVPGLSQSAEEADPLAGTFADEEQT